MTRKKWPTVILYCFLIILLVVCVAPFYAMLVNATHSTNELYVGLNLIPGRHLIENLRNLTSRVNMFRGFRNSLIVACSSTVFTIYFGTMVAFGLFEYQFKGRRVIYMVLMMSMMIPGQLSIIGLFRLCRNLKMIDTYYPIILPSIANASAIFFIMQYLKTTINEELLEAARIDGAGEMRIFHTIILPLSKPAIATQGIFCFVAYWNNFFTPMILLFDEDKFTVPLLINNLNNGMLQDLGAKYAGIALSVVPIIIVYCFVSRHITEGMMAGAVKG